MRLGADSTYGGSHNVSMHERINTGNTSITGLAGKVTVGSCTTSTSLTRAGEGKLPHLIP